MLFSQGGDSDNVLFGQGGDLTGFVYPEVEI